MACFIDNRKSFILFFFIITIPFAFWFCNFWPGIMGPDSFNQWDQMEKWEFYDWHPVFHTMFNWLITRIWNSPASIAIAQIVMFSAVVSWLLVLFINRGMHFLIALAVCAMIAISPLHASLAIFITKDIPYTISFVLLVAILFRYAFPVKAGEDPSHWSDLALLTVALIFTGFFRHNGLPVAIGVAIFLAFKWRSKLTLMALGLFILLSGIIVGPLYNNILNVNQSNKNFLLAVNLLSHIAAHKTMGTRFMDDEEKFLANLVPADKKWVYTPPNVSNTMGSIGQNINYIADNNNAKKLIALTVKLTIRNPIGFIKHIANVTPILWDLSELKSDKTPSNLVLSKNGRKVLTNLVNHLPSSSSDKFAHKTFFPGMDVTLVNILDKFRTIPAIASVSFHLYMLIYLVIISCTIHKSTRDMIIIYPVLLHIVFLAPTVGGDDFRYYYPVYLTAQLFAPFLIVRIGSRLWSLFSPAMKYRTAG